MLKIKRTFLFTILLFSLISIYQFAIPESSSACETNADCTYDCGPNPGGIAYRCDQQCINGSCQNLCPDGNCNLACSGGATTDDPACNGGGGEQCNCTNNSCTAPSGLSWVTGNTSPILTSQPIQWNVPTSWGFDSVPDQNSCENNSCNLTAYSNAGVFKVYEIAGGIEIDRTDYCTESAGTGTIPQNNPKCTLTPNAQALWRGTNKTVKVVAQNQCGNLGIDRTYTFTTNEKPFCEGISITNTTLRNGLHAIRDSESFTVTVNGNDSDGYGLPKFMQICYAVRNQPTSFYLSPGGAAWKCDTRIPNVTSVSKTATFDQLKANYTGVPSYSGTLDENGFVFVSNVWDNLEDNQFCSTNIGYNNGAGVYWSPGGGPHPSCDGGSCVLHLVNRPPEISTVSSVNGWIGTSSDSDNGLSCQDNNPAVYRSTFTDPDGSSDIDRIDLSIGLDSDLQDSNGDGIWDTPQNGGYLPLRIIFGKEWTEPGGQRFANGTFFVRDSNVAARTSPISCYDQNRGLRPIESPGYFPDIPNISNTARFSSSYTVWCFGYDSHTFRDEALLMGQTLNGVLVDVYYLRGDITVFNDGYVSRLKSNANWANSTYVAYERDGNRVFTQFVVEYLPNGDVNEWDGEYKNLWFVRDRFGKTDKTPNLAGERMLIDQWGHGHHLVGNTRIDLTAPPLSVSEPSPISASQLSLNWNASDNLSGLSRIYGEASSSGNSATANITHVGNGQSYDLTQHPPPSSPPPLAMPFLWSNAINGNSQSNAEIIDIGDNEQGSINFEVFVQDNACNLNMVGNQVNLSLPWMITKGGLVYSDEQPDIDIKSLDTSGHPNPDPISSQFVTYPFNISKWEVGLSSELLASGSSINAQHLPNRSLTGAFTLQSYTDNNNRGWFDDLRRSARSEVGTNIDGYSYLVGLNGVIGGDISNISVGGENCNDSEKLCIIESGALSIANPDNPLMCNRETVVFVDGDLNVNADILIDNETNGCIFVVRGNVTIQGGSYKSEAESEPAYDIINAFIVADGYIHVTEDSAEGGNGFRDGIKIRGSLLSFGSGFEPNGGSVSFDRSLKLLDNLLYPSVIIHHDVRYYRIAEKTIGGDNETYKREVGLKP